MQIYDEAPVDMMPGIGIECARTLSMHGLETVGDVREASEEELRAIPGIGDGKMQFINEFSNQ